MPNAQDLLNAQNEEQRTRQSMEYVHSITDLAYVNGNTPTGLGDMTLPVDPQLRSLGDHPELNALILLAGVARHLAPFPGRKSLVWVSSDNVLSGFSEKAPSVEKGNKYIDTAALRAREELNEAHVSIYPLDASQLEAGGVSSQMRSANVQLTPSASPFQISELPPGEREDAEELLRKSQRDVYGGRIKAQMQQDTHAIQPAFRELAEATGGRAIRRAGDIAAELNQIVADGREAYLVSFRPDQPPDGVYHQITVKCTRPGITLRYRTGYFYPNPATTPPAKP
jgi:VWFA-related protein